jgi:tRNA-modifying protein YgfZ
MPTTPVFWAGLDDRSLVRIVGADTRKLLNGLVTSDVDRLDGQPALFAGLLSPQGKILFDFIVVKAGGDAVLLDVAATSAEALIKRLTMYKLRAAVTIEAAPTDLVVGAIWGAAAGAARVPAGIIAYADPRLAALGQRFVAPRGRLPEIPGVPTDSVAYHAHRIAVGVPEGGRDYAFSEAFPHEALFDQLHGVDFEKGCYVGQEVVSRMQHRGTARNRIVQVQGVAPLQAGQPVTAGAASLGTIGSVVQRAGLALIRLDRAHEATVSGQPIMACGVELALIRPAWATFDMTGAKKVDLA